MIVRIQDEFLSWREKARQLLLADVEPNDVSWRIGDDAVDLLGSLEEHTIPPPRLQTVNIPKEFIEQAKRVSFFRDASTWSLLYRMAYRLTHGERNLLEMAIDDDVIDFGQRLKAVSRDRHKMTAFVRFREMQVDGRSLFVAWHQPDHKIFRLAADFFRDRFQAMNWIIFSNDESVSWIDQELEFGPGCPQNAIKVGDDLEDLWKTYYSSIFNPARIKVKAMKKEMPTRHWKTLPESLLIQDLLDEAPERLLKFQENVPTSAKDFIPKEAKTLSDLKAALPKCAACGICAHATAPVFGEGPEDAQIVFIGEQPGDEEDKAGKPFIGPAGQLLESSMDQVGLDRRDIYITNAVKGFKFNPKFGRREHRGASSGEISTCKPWLKAELSVIQPKILVCLGRSAAQSVLGKMIKMDEVRGKFFSTPYAEKTIIIPHPSSILRTADPRQREEAQRRFIAELKLIQDSRAA